LLTLFFRSPPSSPPFSFHVSSKFVGHSPRVPISYPPHHPLSHFFSYRLILVFFLFRLLEDYPSSLTPPPPREVCSRIDLDPSSSSISSHNSSEAFLFLLLISTPISLVSKLLASSFSRYPECSFSTRLPFPFLAKKSIAFSFSTPLPPVVYSYTPVEDFTKSHLKPFPTCTTSSTFFSPFSSTRQSPDNAFLHHPLPLIHTLSKDSLVFHWRTDFTHVFLFSARFFARWFFFFPLVAFDFFPFVFFSFPSAISYLAASARNAIYFRDPCFKARPSL